MTGPSVRSTMERPYAHRAETTDKVPAAREHLVTGIDGFNHQIDGVPCPGCELCGTRPDPLKCRFCGEQHQYADGCENPIPHYVDNSVDLEPPPAGPGGPTDDEMEETLLRQAAPDLSGEGVYGTSATEQEGERQRLRNQELADYVDGLEAQLFQEAFENQHPHATSKDYDYRPGLIGMPEVTMREWIPWFFDEPRRTYRAGFLAGMTVAGILSAVALFFVLLVVNQ